MDTTRFSSFQETTQPFLFSEETRLHVGRTKQNLESAEVIREVYKRECARFNVVPVSAYLRAPSKNSIVIRYYNMGPNGAKALSAPLMLDNIVTHLDIVGNAIGVKGLQFLLQALTDNHSVIHLDISDNNLMSTGAKLLGEFIEQSDNTVLETIVMSDNGFKDEDGLYFAQAIQARLIKGALQSLHVIRPNKEEDNTSLREMVLSSNQFGDVSGAAFGKALGINRTLDSFDISGNQIRKNGAAVFVRRLKDNVGLRKLNIGFNGLGSEGASEMVAVLRTNTTLQELDISHNRLNDLDSVPLAKGLAKNSTLKVLRVGDNLMTSLGATAILHSLHDPKSVSALEILDLRNTNVDLAFERHLKEIKTSKSICVTHGRVISVGDPPLPAETYVRLKTRDHSKPEEKKNKIIAKTGVNTLTVKR